MKVLTILPMVFVVFVAVGCSNSDTGTTADGSVGNLKGQIRILYDSNGHTLQNLSGVTVSAEGTTISGISDSTGIWELRNLPTRTYNLRFSKPGFETMYDMGYSYVGGATSWYTDVQQLTQRPPFTYTFDFFVLPTGSNYNYGKIFAHLPNTIPDSVYIAMSAIFSTSADLDISDPLSYQLRIGMGSKMYFHDDKEKSFTADSWPLNNSTFRSGQTVYCRLYADFFLDAYFDIEKAKTVYVGSGAGSNVLSAIMP